MGDTEHEVKVKVSADIKEFKKSMKDVNATSINLSKMSGRFRANNIKGHKELDKMAKLTMKSRLKEEKTLQKEMQTTIRTMQQKLKASNNDHKSIQKETLLLAKQERQLMKLRSQREKTWGEKLRGGARGALSSMSGLAAAGIGAALGSFIGIMMGQISGAYSAYTQFGAAEGGLIGMGTPKQLGNYNKGARFGFDALQTVQQARQVGRETGDIGSVYTAQAIGRLMGVDPGEAAGWMGQVRRGGAQFGQSKQGSEELKKIIALGMESGIERARLPENIGGVMALLERQRGISAGDISGVGFAQFLSALGRSGLSGFQGAAGGNIAAKIDAAIRGQGGGGENAQALMLQAFGFGKPGAGGSYMGALRSQELGLSDPANFTKVMREITSQFGGGDERALAMKNIFGLSLSQSDELAKLYDSGKMGTEELQKLAAIAEAAKPLEEQALAEMKKGFGGTVKYLAALQNEMIGKGREISDSIRALQKAFNDFIKANWPLVKMTLEILAREIPKLVQLFMEIKDRLFGENTPGRIAAKKINRVIDSAGRGTPSAVKSPLRALESLRQTQQTGGYSIWDLITPTIVRKGELPGEVSRQAQSARMANIAGAGSRIRSLTDLPGASMGKMLIATRRLGRSGTSAAEAMEGLTPEQRTIMEAALRAQLAHAETSHTVEQLLTQNQQLLERMPQHMQEVGGVTPATHGRPPPRNSER